MNSVFRNVCLVLVLGVLLPVRMVIGFGYLSADETRGVDVINHPKGYVGAGEELVITVGIRPGSAYAASMEIPLRNVVRAWNALQPDVENLSDGDENNVPDSFIDWESVMMHEMGHALGLGHPNLGTAGEQREFTRSTDGVNNTYDVDAGTDGVPGSCDDVRGDDQNMTWFRRVNNNPFTIASTVDATTYSVSLADLPSGHQYSANAGREVADELGRPDAEAVMQMGTAVDEAQRSLIADDVAAMLYAMSGLDEQAGTDDDYTVRLVYAGIDAGADVLVGCDSSETTFAITRVSSTGLAGQHRAVTSAKSFFHPGVNWFFNDQLVLGDPLDVSPRDDMTAQGFQGGTFEPTCGVYTVSNNGTSSLTWAVSHAWTWLTVMPEGGVLATGEQVSVSVCLNGEANGLVAGSHADTVTFSNVSTGVTHERGVLLVVRGLATLPFSEGFESGTLSPFWTVSGTGKFRSRVTSEAGPYSGAYHLTLDDIVTGGDYARNEVTLCVDLEGRTNVVLSFRAREYGDESHAPPSASFTGGADFDGVAISADEWHWHEVQPLRFPSVGEEYSLLTVDLDAAVALYGLSYTPRFFIRFNQYDNSCINYAESPNNSDGIGIDDITIEGQLAVVTCELIIDGQPSVHGDVSPLNYGTHAVALGSNLNLTVTSPMAGEGGERFVCAGWVGTGDVPEQGESGHVEFVMSQDSTIVWLWQREYALEQTSTVSGIVQVTTWHREEESVATVAVPACIDVAGTQYRFCEWRVDGRRCPEDTGPAVNPVCGIVMSTSHVASVAYLPVDEDMDENGLLDWFEIRYFGDSVVAVDDDTDCDGADNAHEQYAGTDPTDPDSVLAVGHIAVADGGALCRVTVRTEPGMSYAIEFCPLQRVVDGLEWFTFTNMQNGVGSWMETGSVRGTFTFIDDFTTNTSGSIPGTTSVRLYRVRVVGP